MKNIEEVIFDLNSEEKLSFQHVPWHKEEFRSFCRNREKDCLDNNCCVNRNTERFRAKMKQHYWMKYEVCLTCGWSEHSITNFMPWYFGKKDGY